MFWSLFLLLSFLITTTAAADESGVTLRTDDHLIAPAERSAEHVAAEETYEHYLQLLEQTRNDRGEEAIFVLEAQGDLAMELGQHDAAYVRYAKAIKIRNDLYGPGRPENLDAIRRLAALSFRKHDPDEAFKTLDLVTTLENGSGHPMVKRLAELHRGLHELTAELASPPTAGGQRELLVERGQQQQVEIAAIMTALRRARTAESWWRLARLSARQGNGTAAREQAKRALETWRRWPSEIEAGSPRLAELLRFHLDLLASGAPLEGFDDSFLISQLLRGQPDDILIADREPLAASSEEVERLERDRLAARHDVEQLASALALAAQELEDAQESGQDERRDAARRQVDRLESDLEFTRVRLELAEERLRELGVDLDGDGAQEGHQLMTAEEARQLLGQGEALLTYIVFEDASYHWMIRAEEARWQKVKMGREDLEKSTADLTASLERFQLFFRLFSWSEPLLRGVERLFVVVDPTIGAVPPLFASNPAETPPRTTLALDTVSGLRSPEKATAVETPAAPTNQDYQRVSGQQNFIEALENIQKLFAKEDDPEPDGIDRP